MAKATAKSNCADWYYLIDVNVRFIETVETGISWKSWFPIGIRTSFFGGKDFEDLACKMLRISSNVGNVGPLKTHSLLHTAQDNKKSQANQKTVRTCKNKNGGIFHAIPAPHVVLLSIECMRICICWCLRRNSRRTQVADSAISWASTLVHRSFTLPLPRSLQRWWL